MKNIITAILFVLFVFTSGLRGYGQADNNNVKKITDYQIFLKQPAKEIKHLMYDKNFMPIQGKLSEDKKSVILKQYEPGNKVRVKVVYEDGTTEEFVKSPCYIDPVIL